MLPAAQLMSLTAIPDRPRAVMACAGASQVLFLAKSMRLALVLLMNRMHEATTEKH